MLTNDVLELISAVILAALMVRYWKQVLVVVLVASTTVFCFGLLQIISIFRA